MRFGEQVEVSGKMRHPPEVSAAPAFNKGKPIAASEELDVGAGHPWLAFATAAHTAGRVFELQNEIEWHQDRSRGIAHQNRIAPKYMRRPET